MGARSDVPLAPIAGAKQALGSVATAAVGKGSGNRKEMDPIDRDTRLNETGIVRNDTVFIPG